MNSTNNPCLFNRLKLIGFTFLLAAFIFTTNSVKLKGLVYKSGGELAITLDTDPSTEVTNPRNFTYSLGVMPQPESQDIHLAVSSTDKFVKKLGCQSAIGLIMVPQGFIKTLSGCS